MMRRRELLRSLGLGAGAMVLAPLLGRLISEARGQSPERRLLFVLSDGNGWMHQSNRGRDPEDLNPAREGELPAVLDSLAPFADRVTILRNLYNPHGRNLHGNGWATLSVAPSSGNNPGGISLDRMVGRELGAEDPFSSVALGLQVRENKDTVSTSADGPDRPFPAEGSPARAFATLFGASEGVPERVLEGLRQERSILDGMGDDLRRLQTSLAAAERGRVEQLLGSLRELEMQLASRLDTLGERGAPEGPDADQEYWGLKPEVVRDHVEVAAMAYAFGLTRVVHLSIYGRDAHNVGWGFLGFGGDAHEAVAHVSRDYDRDRSTEAYRAIIRYKAGELAHLWGRLAAERTGDGSLADKAVAIWVNSGGGKHHEGTDTIPLVLLGDAGGALRTGGHHRYERREACISQAFLSVAQAVGSRATVFGDPEHCPGALEDLLA